MINEKSILVLEDFLRQHTELNQVNTHHVLGFMSGLLACSEFYGESVIANYIADDNEQAYSLLMNDSKERDALITVLDNVTEAQVEQTHILKQIYPHDTNAQAPSEPLQQWCSGYLAAYLVNQEVWQQDFNFLLNVDKQQAAVDTDGQLFIDNFEATLNLLATFAMWPDALKEHPEPETLNSGFNVLYAGLDESLVSIASMALMLEDEKLALWEEEG
ncbi:MULTISPECIES: UPF0149 family protein [unclassified Pseudoalteromonas]|uniref:UPF0149 family protein n=2 Tax=Bacteria TaxID=2 RepID=UPI000B3D2149|nr:MULTISPECIES: UPF0149 family protein [unclassified Pseudoalteromonas]MDN3380559.1 UPF0149 family protein [Pseudoalteromonas sp. APC 3893]MDN3388982.1 UPF0149 family protein [Pseudoalteromonas sp. APC 4017]OUS68813.1 hypothetical protein B5G52_18440 [Pseudoalteromonas sp. A601]